MTLLAVLQGNYVQMSISDVVINYIPQIVGIPEPDVRGDISYCGVQNVPSDYRFHTASYLHCFTSSMLSFKSLKFLEFWDWQWHCQSFRVCSLGLFSFVRSSLEEDETFRISGIQESPWPAGLAFHPGLLARHCRRCRRHARGEIHHSAFAAVAGRGWVPRAPVGCRNIREHPWDAWRRVPGLVVWSLPYPCIDSRAPSQEGEQGEASASCVLASSEASVLSWLPGQDSVKNDISCSWLAGMSAM